MKVGKEDLLVDISKLTREISDIFSPSEAMEDFLNLHGKQEPRP